MSLFCKSSRLITEINILRCMVSKTSKFVAKYVYDCLVLSVQTQRCIVH